MYFHLIKTFLSLTMFASPLAQAEALLDYAPKSLVDDEVRTVFSPSGSIWLAYRGGSVGDVYAASIAPNGKSTLGDIFIAQREIGSPWLYIARSITCDRWSNVYFLYTTEGKRGSGHLVRITPEGKVDDYYPWPADQYSYDHYIGILPGDSLLILSPHPNSGGRMAKALISPEGITPIYDSLYSPEDYPNRAGQINPITKNYLDWQKAWGFQAWIRKDGIYILQLNLNPKGLEKQIMHGPYEWQDYVWRSYSDAPIGYLTLVPYQEGGYIMCFFDPDDKSTTHLVRLDEDGLPIDPSTLDKGGTLSARHFKNLPSSAEPHVDFWIWRTHKKRTPRDSYFVLDSARVRFWGCDDEGNLYVYQKSRTY